MRAFCTCRPDTISKVSGKGMKSSGDLYVVWKVAMPDQPLKDDDKAQLRQILGGSSAASPHASVGTVTVTTKRQ